MESDQRESQEVTARDVVSRWGGYNSVFTDGFLAVPLVLLKNLPSVGEYGVTPAEAVFILQLMTFKWDTRSPYPSYARLSQQMGISETYARKLARSLEEKGLLNREERKGTTNRFDLRPLFRELKELGDTVDSQKESDEEMDLPF